MQERGTRAPAYCPSCGKAQSIDTTACPNCGTAFGPTTVSAHLSGVTNSTAPAPKSGGTTARRAAMTLIVLGGLYAISQMTGGTKPAPAPAAGGAGATQAATPASAWRLAVGDMTGTTRTSVGETITVEVTISNSGSAPNPGTRLQFSDLDKSADLIGCRPKCQYTDLFGIYTDLPGIPAGGSSTFVVEWIAKAIGAPDWTLCVYDNTSGGEQIECGTLTTVIGK